MKSKEDEKRDTKGFTRKKCKIIKKNYLCFWSKLLRQVSAAQCLELLTA